MARTTNSDTLPYAESRYELGMLASQRVRDLNGGAEPVVALREIASGKLDVNAVRHEFVQSYKDAPSAADGAESLEIGSEDPLLREIDAELEATLADDEPGSITVDEAVEAATSDAE